MYNSKKLRTFAPQKAVTSANAATMKQFTVDPNMTYTYNSVEQKNVIKKYHSGYVRVKKVTYYQPVPPMDCVVGTFQLEK